MLDIHTHLYWKSYDADRDAVVERARAAGLTKMICVGTEPADNPQVLVMAERYEDVYASVGLHPHFFNQVTDNNKQLTGEIEELRKLAEHKKVVSIGECGLDYYSHQLTDNNQREVITDEQKKLQKEGFIAQIEIAEEFDLPLIIHTRPSAGTMDAYEDMFEILRDTKYAIRDTVLHCYQGDTEITKKFLGLPNIYFSFAGNITYPVKKLLAGTKDDLVETVKLVPLERLFVETDCPFLAPQSKRGQRNEPAFVCETAEFVASLKGVSGEELNRQVTKNSENVFD